MGLLPMDIDILPPSDDRVFKLILTSPEAKPGLIRLIAGVIGRPVIDVTVHNNELPVSDTMEKAERFDVNCVINDGSQINLEMQASRIEEEPGGEHRNLKGKSIYYLCDLHSSQSSKGQRRYDRLARSYQITFCSYTVFPNRSGYVNPYSMRHDLDNELLHDAVRVVFVELSKLEEILLKPVETMTDLEKFAVFFQYAPSQEHRGIVNKIIESEEVLKVAGSLLMNISQDERERAIFRSRRKFQTDMDSNLATAEARGEAKGEARGENKKAFEVARNALRKKMTVEDIIDLTGLTREEIEGLSG
ncbi:MAG: Rpn family recombination-promoting nuclease/putative transposase [Oscillospiraceae bacterium]|nr:Rpn family recombination-promoting nuclease/putative transposase [Oscillospiraceae bacterium]